MEAEIIGQMDNTIDHTFESANRVYDKEKLCPTLPTCCGGGHQPKIIDNETGLMPTLTAGTHGYANAHINSDTVKTRYRIRKLTPRECWRLMNFTDSDYDKAAFVVSNTQLYKTAGNSIVVSVLSAIFFNPALSFPYHKSISPTSL